MLGNLRATLPALVALMITACHADDMSMSKGEDTTSGTTTMMATSDATTSTASTATSTTATTTTTSDTTVSTDSTTTTTTTTTTADPTTDPTIDPTTDPTTTSTTDPTTGTTGEPACAPGDDVVDFGPSFLWIANTDDGTVSKIETAKSVEVARMRVGPMGAAESVSRTAVSYDGRWATVASRGTGRVTLFAANLSECVDKNNNGMIDTSLAKDDVRPWGEDECQIWSINVPYAGPLESGPQGMTWTPGTWNQDACAFEDPAIWVGFLPVQPSTAQVVRLDPATGDVKATLNISQWTMGDAKYAPFNAALAPDGKVWVSQFRGEIFRIDVAKQPLAFERWTPPANLQIFGMTIDPEGKLWFGGCSGPVSTYDPVSDNFATVANTLACHRGLAADGNGNLWVASSGPCGIAQIDRASRTLIAYHDLPLCTTPIGVSLDDEGYVWLVDDAGATWKIDPADPTMPAQLAVKGKHYTLGDMSGRQIRSVNGH